MRKGNEEFKAYKSIIQNLVTLKGKIAMTRPGEAKAIEAILQSLFNLNGDLQLSTASIHEDVQSGENGYNKILVHAH